MRLKHKYATHVGVVRDQNLRKPFYYLRVLAEPRDWFGVKEHYQYVHEDDAVDITARDNMGRSCNLNSFDSVWLITRLTAYLYNTHYLVRMD